jgi:RNA polymerase primary sigma factor
MAVESALTNNQSNNYVNRIAEIVLNSIQKKIKDNKITEKCIKNFVYTSETTKNEFKESIISQVIVTLLENNIYVVPENETDDKKSLIAFDMYLSEISKTDKIYYTKEIELELGKKAALGDKAIRNDLVEKYLRYAIFLAKKYQNKGIELEDLIQYANEGLLIGIDKYKCELGYKVSTYVTYWIINALNRAITNEARTIRIPVYKESDIVQMKKTIELLEKDLNRTPTHIEIAEALGITVDELLELNNIIKPIVPLHTQIGEESDSCLLDIIPSNDESYMPEKKTVEIILKEEIMRLLNHILNPIEVKVLELRFGLIDNEEKTQEEIATAWQLSKNVICQKEKRALNKLREHPEVITKLGAYLELTYDVDDIRPKECIEKCKRKIIDIILPEEDNPLVIYVLRKRLGLIDKQYHSFVTIGEDLNLSAKETEKIYNDKMNELIDKKILLPIEVEIASYRISAAIKNERQRKHNQAQRAMQK